MADAEDATGRVDADGGRGGICRHTLEDARVVVFNLRYRQCACVFGEGEKADLVVEEIAPRI